MSLRILFYGLELIGILDLMLGPFAEEPLSTAVQVSNCVSCVVDRIRNLQCVHHAILAVSKLVNSLDALSRNLNLAPVVTSGWLSTRCLAEERVF